MPDPKVEKTRLPLYCYLFPLLGGAGLGFFIQYRKFERGFDSLVGIRLLILMALFSLIMLWLWKFEGLAVSRIFKTPSDRAFRHLCYAYGSPVLLFFYPLLRKYVLTNVHESFRLVAISTLVMMAVLAMIGLFYASRKPDGNGAASLGWSQAALLLCIAVLYYAHQISYIRTHESTWSNHTAAHEVRKAITVFPGASLRFDGVVSQQPVRDLSIAVAPVDTIEFMRPECRIELKLIDQRGEILEEHSALTPLPREWTECRFRVRIPEGETLTVDVNTTSYPERPWRRRLNEFISYSNFPWREPKGFLLALTRPRIVAEKDQSFPNVILISVDTLRADHVGVYGGGSLTPAMDALANDGIVFQNAIVPSTWTLPSHMSIMTSLYASYHGVTDTNIVVSDFPLTTIAELLQNSGYATAAFTGNGYLSAKYGFSKGFDSYYERYAYKGEVEAADVFNRGKNWVRQHGNNRFFLFLHTYEAHNYLYKQLHHMSYADENYDGFFASVSLEQVLPNFGKGANDPAIAAEDIQFLKDLYRGAVRTTDQELGKFLAALREEGLYDDTLIILTSDHGEGFGETHASPSAVWHHGRDPYTEQANVPLIVKMPANMTFSKKSSVQDWVSIIDIAPTISEVCGLPIPAQFQGLSLIPFISVGNQPPARSLFTEVLSSVATYSDNSVYIHFLQPNRKDELYDLQDDADQRQNLLGRKDGESMIEAINEHLTTSADYNAPKYRQEPLDEEIAGHLRALGYLQ